ncbi:DUF5337 domain-containing protein [uncultured Roseovarius sp.]|uniref:DUF5337 domain-containing protein n=1 Tax=uncultured Roseovarius sp. TaxID=293344 RepID=UPI002607C299|nr:DUF5337 domain-containing protein [uncultured Roseovarius sp.]
MGGKEDESRKGRQAALVIAGTAVFWVVASFVGGQLGLDNRTRALLDLIALAGFIWALWMIFQIWRARQDNQG